ncbi:MAG TPA: sugar transferase [Rectinema sp.]|jgi:lipopolysaccharide/colanic/teichoic acid biosynthesis glycosyltransferase|nr:sugar transferase [Rectinema sp.]HOO02005.1 sugar transferase [Rectinema sp.]HPN03853.1 sugar transferase [Rectinema sp.]HQB07762.1 sugar transferase [Rectinema sp.]
MTIEAQMRLTRFLDIVFSFVCIVVLLPLMIPIMIILKLTGEHHIFYRQQRVGKGGKQFYVLKFATMVDSLDKPGELLTQKDDPRVTPIGRFLRKMKINELPQLVNILVGQMSFVGPRPQVREHYELYSPEAREAIDKFRPGLTGLASMIFRNESEILDRVDADRNHFHDTVIAPYKGELELWYSHHCGWRSYFLLLALTVWELFRPDDSKAWRHFYNDIPKPPKELEPYL